MEEKMPFDEALKSIMTIMADSFERETIDGNEEMLDRLRAVKSKSKRFWSICESAQFRFNALVASLLEIPPQKNVYIAEHIASGLYEHYFKRLMESKEGSAGCADKSRFIRKSTIAALQEKKNISLYEEYKDEKTKAYWSPETIPDTDTAISMFLDWYLLREKKSD